MGKAKSYEVIEYRKIIEKQICKSQELVKLLGCENIENPEEIIPYKYSYPHEYIPDTITTTDKFINYDISAYIDEKNNTYKDLTINFFVVCHCDVSIYEEKSKKYLWWDRVVCELDNIFTETNLLGVGKTYLISNAPYCPQKNFKGRLLTFKVKDFTNGLKNGK